MHAGRRTQYLTALACACLLAVAHAQGMDGSAAPVSQDASTGSAAQADPPTRVVRISLLQGSVSTEPASVNQFSPAEMNQVLTSGDRVYTDAAATAELEAGQIAVRLGGGTDLTVTSMTDQLAQFGLASGSIHLRSFAIDPGTVLELDSPEAALTVLQAGDVRVDEDPAQHATTVFVLSGQAQIDGPQISRQIGPGERVRVHGADPQTGQVAYLEPLAPDSADALDGFSDSRDTLYANGAQAGADYLNPDTTGGADLASYGSWDTSGDYGPVWYPVVAVGWRPYTHGHWCWVAPWGWTWVGVEPWGFAPFHYGRWLAVDGRWGWIPGVRAVRPVYAPALVAFVGGAQFSTALGYGPGTGIAAWFPLGPREPYAPWYQGSTLYVNRVNASNLYNRDTAEAQAFYNQRAVSVYVTTSLPKRSYANRAQGTVAVSQTSFAAGQPVARNLLSIPAGQLAEAPLLPHPMVNPERSMVVNGQARAVPPQAQRPSNEAGVTEPISRPAFVRTRPPVEPRPNFEEQRQAMQRADPGRPLSPQQLENMHQSRPAGPPTTRESVPHPAPGRPAAEAARPAPAPASSKH